MITQTSLDRFYKLREKLFDEIKKILEEDGYCKSYEGAMAIGFPNYLQGRDESEDKFSITLDCYVVGPSRHYQWFGKTFEESLSKAENEILSWIIKD